MITRKAFRSNGHLTGFTEGQQVEVITRPGLPSFVPGLARTSCALCGARLFLQPDGDEVKVRDACPVPDGITTVITLSLPSGKAVVTDDLRPVYDWDDDQVTDYNSALGQAQATEAMAAQGCAYGPVGNTSPGLYRTGEGTYVIASPAYDQDEDAELVPDGWVLLARVITDLWAYSIADYGDWLARGGDPARLRYAGAVIELPAGDYRFTHHTGERSFDQDAEGTVVYADIEFAREES